MMKKVALCFMCVLLGLSSRAQEYPGNEISLTYGGISVPYVAVSVAGIFGSIIASVITDGEVTLEHVGTSGNLSTQYYHNINPHFGFGAEVVYERCSMVFTGQNSTSINFLSIMPSVKGRWFQGQAFGMYSRASLGVSTTIIPIFELIDGTTPLEGGLGYHVVPLGMSFGSKNLKGVCELGIGMGPMASVGLVYGF